MHKYTLLLIIFSATANVIAADDTRCFVEGKYQDYSIKHPLCLFYTGTENYRNKKYLEASMNWEVLLSIKPVPKEYSELFASAHNNLGFLYFHGLGVQRNSTIALKYWHKAISLGNEEAEYHLCYAYGAPDSPVYSPTKALPHCNKAEYIYSGKKTKDEGDMEILKIIRKYKALVVKE